MITSLDQLDVNGTYSYADYLKSVSYTHLDVYKRQKQLSDTLHSCIVEAFQYPENKRAHRFFELEPEDFYYPEGRTNFYTCLLYTSRCV